MEFRFEMKDFNSTLVITFEEEYDINEITEIIEDAYHEYMNAKDEDMDEELDSCSVGKLIEYRLDCEEYYVGDYYEEYHKGSSKNLIYTAFPEYLSLIREKQNNEQFKGFFVLQTQLTDGYLIFGPWARERSHNERLSEYIRNIRCLY